jgi:hypothetical protein
MNLHCPILLIRVITIFWLCGPAREDENGVESRAGVSHYILLVRVVSHHILLEPFPIYLELVSGPLVLVVGDESASFP